MSRMLNALKNLEAREVSTTSDAPAQEAIASADAATQSEVMNEATIPSGNGAAFLEHLMAEHRGIEAQLQFADNALAWLADDSAFTVSTAEAIPSTDFPSSEYELLQPVQRSAAPVLIDTSLGMVPVIPVANATKSFGANKTETRFESEPLNVVPPVVSEIERSVRTELYEPDTLSQYQQMATKLRQEVVSTSGRSMLLTGCAGSVSRDLLLHLALLYGDEGEKVLVVDADLGQHPLSRALLSTHDGRLEQALRRLLRPTAYLQRVMPLASSGVSLLALQAADVSTTELGSMQREWELLKHRFTMILVDGGTVPTAALRILGQLCDATFMVVSLGTTDAMAAKQHVEYLQSAGANVLGCLATID
ncbi:MAG: hypothetical protein ACO1RA_10700 [Planctomycetaceae bacterium]